MSLIILAAVILYVIKVWCFLRLLLWLGSLNLKQNISRELKAWFPYRVCRTKKIHRTDTALSLVSISLYLSCQSYEKNS